MAAYDDQQEINLHLGKNHVFSEFLIDFEFVDYIFSDNEFYVCDPAFDRLFPYFVMLMLMHINII